MTFQTCLRTLLIACLSLAFFVEPQIWLAGIGLILLAAVWHSAARRLTAPPGA